MVTSAEISDFYNGSVAYIGLFCTFETQVFKFY